ncbi:MAG: hypothetical protein SFW62_06535 [Alphaproteobacteria bacterium]|nr:hypothetical protein [Alphaproteobacteria bacterium]
MPNKKILLLAVLGLGLVPSTTLQAQHGAVPKAPETTPALKATPLVADTSIRPTIGDVTDSRTTGKFFEYLRIEIKLSGTSLENVFGVSKPIVTAAVDDTGKSLIKDDAKEKPLFWELQKSEDNKKNFDDTVDLLNPLRQATTISLAGYINVLDPKQDPASIYIVKNFLGSAGQPLLPKNMQKYGLDMTVLTKALADKMKQDKAKSKAEADQKKAAGASDTQNLQQSMEQAFGKIFESLFSGFISMGDNDLLFIIKDPSGQVAYLEVIDETGAVIKSGNGRSMSQDKEKGTTNYTASYNAPIPPTAQLKIYLATPKSLTRVPFRFENVPLP